jgi:hypothetical protein
MDKLIPPISHESLLEAISYNPLTGEFKWRKRERGRRFNKPPGSINNNGHLEIKINKFRYRAHQWAWFYVYGEWPERDIDHDNGIKTDNRIKNLRLATNAQNSQNKGKTKSNTSGYKGVSKCKRTGKWRAQIMVNLKAINLGVFACPELAHLVYAEHAAKLHGDFARTE